MAENKLATKISDGDTTCLIFFLKTQGKKRGYIERQELDADVNGKVTVQWEEPPTRDSEH